MTRTKKLTVPQFRALFTNAPDDTTIGTWSELAPEVYYHFMRTFRRTIEDPEQLEAVELRLRDWCECMIALNSTPTPLDLAVQRYEAALEPARRDETGNTAGDLIYIEIMKNQLRSCKTEERVQEVRGSIVRAMERILSRYERTDWEEVNAAYADMQALMKQANDEEAASA